MYSFIKVQEDLHEILEYFAPCFEPPLTQTVADLKAYSKKLADCAVCVLAKKKEPCGFIAFYANDLISHTAYISLIVVKETCRGTGLAQELLELCIKEALKRKMTQLKLEVRKTNQRAISFYKKNGFKVTTGGSSELIYLLKELNSNI